MNKEELIAKLESIRLKIGPGSLYFERLEGAHNLDDLIENLREEYIDGM